MDPSTTDAFDVTNVGNTYALGSGTSFNPAGFDVRDLFGGQYDSFSGERGDVVFADNQPIGTSELVDVTLVQPGSLMAWNLIAAEDAGGGRSCREVKIFAVVAGVDVLLQDVPILDASGTQSYGSVYGGTAINVFSNLANSPVTNQYVLEFDQNQAANASSGIRLVEFDGYVPEPSEVYMLVIAPALLLRPRPNPRGD
jgi:hypothetical protein